MKKYHVIGLDRETGKAVHSVVEANGKDEAARSAGFVVEKVKTYRDPIALSSLELPQYPALLYSSKIIRWGSVALGIIYTFLQILSWYVGLYGSWTEVQASATSGGVATKVVSLVAGLIFFGILYVAGELILAIRDIAINSHSQTG